MELRSAALQALELDDPVAKVAAVRALDVAAGPVDTQVLLQPRQVLPGRPIKPRLVHPNSLPRRSAHSPAGRAALLHAVAHIEFNAINLALDAAWRFPGLPEAYYRDWLRVAAEEACTSRWWPSHLATLGHAYGDFDAHDGLWSMTERTAVTPSHAWRWCRARWRRAAWTPRRRCRRNCARPATRTPWPSWT
jgi:uncharacterized ferritin-like protein (DUF455 family)